IGRDRQSVDPPRMPPDDPRRTPGSQLKDTNSWIGTRTARAHDPPVTRHKRHTAHRSGVVSELPLLESRVHVPETYGPVIAAGEGSPAVRRKDDAAYPVGVAR